MALLTVTQVTRSGGTPAFAAAAGGGDTFPNNGNTFLVVRNTGGSICNVTINSIKSCDQGFDHDQTVAVPATTGERWIGPLATDRWNDPSTGLVSVTYNQVTGVSVAVAQM